MREQAKIVVTDREKVKLQSWGHLGMPGHGYVTTMFMDNCGPPLLCLLQIMPV